MKTTAQNEMLRHAILARLPAPGSIEPPIQGLTLSRQNHPTNTHRCVFKPVVLSLLGGQKHSILGTREFIYGDGQTMVTSMDIPCVSRVTHATPRKPYVGIMLELDPVLIIDLVKELRLPKPQKILHRSMALGPSDPAILNAFTRLLDLLDEPENQRAILAPMIIREIHCRLLTGPWASQLQMLATTGAQGYPITKAVAWIKTHFSENFRIDDLAARVNMAPASFYRHFSKVMSLSPIQYQKQLRLHEAKRLMLAGADSAHAAYAVGYESTTQFSKEYKRLFANPPRADIRHLQAM